MIKVDAAAVLIESVGQHPFRSARSGSQVLPLSISVYTWCIDSEGRKHLLHLAVGNKESEAAWNEFFRNMLSRGMRLPATVTTDGAPGMIKAVEVAFSSSIRVRCWFHRLANIRGKLPDDEAAEVMAHLYAVRDAPTLDA